MTTLYEMLYGKRIANVYDGRPDGSVLIRLDDTTELTVFAGTIRDDSDDDPIRIGVGAAVPDLLAACETHVRLEEIHRAQPQRGVDFEDSFAQMKAAIAKAQP